MWKIVKYSLIDLLRSRWSLVYFLFYLLLGYILLFLNNDLSAALVTMMNVIIVMTPLIGTIFGVMYYYSSSEFTDLLLAQPIRRFHIILGQYLGISLSLSLSLILGLGIPFVSYGIFNTLEIWNFGVLLLVGTALTFIFICLAIIICLKNQNRIKGFGYAILLWLFFAVIYDGMLLLSLVAFEEYPLDKFSLIMSMLNPIDLSRIMILLKLDISALMGYTGAVFQDFFGTFQGTITSSAALLIWILVPVYIMRRITVAKDF